MVLALFGLTYLGLAAGKVPGLRLDRAAIALVGAAAMLALGVIDVREAARAVDEQTMVLLFGMMVLVAYLRMSGFFALATEGIALICPGPRSLLAVTIGLSGLLSAFLVNDVVCLAMTPLVLALCGRLGRPSIPYLVALATASNIGSAATITGNPQNMMIGSFSGIAYARFSSRMAPVAVIGLVLDYLVVLAVYRKVLTGTGDGPKPALVRPRVHRGLLIRCVVVILSTVVLFFAGQPVAVAALASAAVLMLDRVRPEKVYRAVDWPLLVMFAGLFVVVHAFEVKVVRGWDPRAIDPPVLLISGLSVLLSNLVSNVPTVLLFRPWMELASQKEQAWLALAMSSTLAGNLTLLGSVANLIVAENARRLGTELGFLEYLKVGVPLTMLTIAVGVIWLLYLKY